MFGANEGEGIMALDMTLNLKNPTEQSWKWHEFLEIWRRESCYGSFG
jgi:hypothetical protein